MSAFLSIDNVTVEYPVAGRKLSAVSDVSLSVAKGETLGLVGESGCGKSTLGRAVLQLRPPTAGRVTFDGTELTSLSADAMRRMRRRLQLIFQDPIASLNPRRCVGDIIAEPLIIAGVRALDVSVQAQILNLLEEMKRRYGLTLLFIAHDLAVVKAVSDRIAVMYLGKLCEVAETEQLFRQPAHPYTALLLQAIPVPDPTVKPATNLVTGEPPSPLDPPSGCRFRTRCPRADARCAAEDVAVIEAGSGERPMLRPVDGEALGATR